MYISKQDCLSVPQKESVEEKHQVSCLQFFLFKINLHIEMLHSVLNKAKNVKKNILIPEKISFCYIDICKCIHICDCMQLSMKYT